MAGLSAYGPPVMKVTVLYSPPTDADAFEEHYGSVHVPLARAMPGVSRVETSRVISTPDGSPAPYYRTADLYFDDPDAMQASLSSEEGRRTAKDALGLAARTGSSVTFLVTAVD